MRKPGYIFENVTTAEINSMASQAIKVNGTFPNQTVSIC